MKLDYPLLRCLAIYRLMPKRFVLTASLITAANGCQAWQQWMIGRLIHEVERGSAVVQLPTGALDFSGLQQGLIFLAAIALARAVVQYFGGILALTIGQELLSILRERILVQVQRLDLGYHWRHGVGEMVTRTTRDADKVRDALVSFWRQVFDTLLVIVSSIGLLFWYDPRLAAVPLGLTILGFVIFILQTERLVTLDRAVGEAYDRVNQDLSEGITGVRVIKAFALEPVRVARFAEQVQIFAEQARAALAYSAFRIPIPQAVVAMGHVWILLFGAQLVAAGELNLGELVAALLAATTLVFRVDGIGRVMQVFADARSSAARIWELLDADPAFEPGTRPLPEGPLGLKLADVGITVPGGGTDILKGVSFRVEPGEIVALVGATGAGKSTLASLLPRLQDVDEGMIAVGSDTQGWFDIRRLDPTELRRRVHVVPQDSFLFSDTLRANLLLTAPEASELDLLEAIRLAAAEDVLAGLPDGLDTRIGDRGITLSGGQRQRISLARALLANPAILGLDDATSALDAVTERTILDNIRERQRNAGRTTTVLMIASKLSTVLLADRIVMLSGGRIVADGTHEELARTRADYRDLVGLDHG